MGISNEKQILHEETWTLFPQGNTKIEIESLLTAVQNNTITTYIKIKIDNTRKKASRLCYDRYETINHMINECRKLTQKKIKTR